VTLPVPTINWSTWLPIIIAALALMVSALALIGTLGNFLLVLWRGRRHVRIRSSQVWKPPVVWRADETAEDDEGYFVYQCGITNTGYIGVQIERVELRSKGGANVGIVLELAPNEQPRKLDQGESQNWETALDELKNTLPGEGAIKLIVLAVDTTGKEYVQRERDALPIPRGQ
jgi:hypothetical protein